MNLAHPRIRESLRDEVVEFSIHDLIGIRLIGPSAGDVRTVSRQLGLNPVALAAEPALTIRFVDQLRLRGPMRTIGRDDVGFTDDAFVLLRSRNLARARTRISFDTIGADCEITCETGLPAIPLLRNLLNVIMLARGILPVHAAAFNYEGSGVLVAGWSHGSKTGTMLAFMAQGAQFVGDEWIYVTPGGERIYGLADELEARPWYLRELPAYRRKVRTADRLRLSGAGALARALAPLASRSQRSGTKMAKLVRLAHEALLNQQSVHLRPTSLFGPEACALQSRLDVVILALSHAAPEVIVEAADIDRLARRMAASFVHEQDSLMCCYRKHAFAFPERRNQLLDNVEEIYRDCALKALSGKKGYTMFHPYPVGVSALRDAVRPLL